MRQVVPHRSVSISKTAPNFVPCPNFLAAAPSNASRIQLVRYRVVAVMASSGI